MAAERGAHLGERVGHELGGGELHVASVAERDAGAADAYLARHPGRLELHRLVHDVDALVTERLADLGAVRPGTLGGVSGARTEMWPADEWTRRAVEHTDASVGPQ